jgi:manganese transport protein
VLFGVALLAAGRVSAVTGTLAGQVVMEGFLRWRVSPAARRLITRAIAIVPAIIVTALCGEGATGQLLVLSQVILSLQLSFAVVPLVMFTGDRALMGPFANSGLARVAGAAAAATIAVLNFWLVWQVLA